MNRKVMPELSAWSQRFDAPPVRNVSALEPARTWTGRFERHDTLTAVA